MNSHVAFGDPSATLLQIYFDSSASSSAGSRAERTHRTDLRHRQRRYQRGARLRKLLG